MVGEVFADAGLTFRLMYLNTTARRRSNAFLASRRMTPIAPLQWFSDAFAFERTKAGVLKQFGNAASVRLGAELARQSRTYSLETCDVSPARPDVYEQQLLTDLE